MTSDPRDALATALKAWWAEVTEQGAYITHLNHREAADAILANLPTGWQFSPAQAAEQDRLVALGKAVERLPHEDWTLTHYANLSTGESRYRLVRLWRSRSIRQHRTIPEAIAAALDEPVTGEPER